MGTRENMFSEFLDLVKSWFPRRSEPAYVSRDFWMPDNSCRVCYDCDTQFTLFVRKHHCRLCGRVFCGKCTANSIPVPSADPMNGHSEGDWVRVCNFCFKQWQQEVAAAAMVTRSSNVGMDNSSSSASLVSTRSSGTHMSSTMTTGSISYSNGPFQRNQFCANSSPTKSLVLDHVTDKQDMLLLGRNADSGADLTDACSSHFNYCMNNRSDDDDDDVYGALHSDSEIPHFQHSDDYYGRVEFDEIDQDYDANKVHHAEENVSSNDVGSPIFDRTMLRDSMSSDKVVETGTDHSDECGAASSMYALECADEPVDFENNGLLWLPPEPEDEEDEKEAILLDDEDDVSGEWGYLRPSRSFGSGEFRTRDQSTEEHRRVMKNVVGGHFRALIAQLLQVENLPIGEEGDMESWLEIITSLSWEAATLLKPDTSKGGGMDPGGYVKVKCIACGRRSQSAVVRGIVCKKNVAHRRMMSKIQKPRFLILGGALEYQRVMNSLSSFDTLLQQEMDHLKMAVARIDSHNPDVLLVEKSVSRFAQDYLLAKDISLVLNIKKPLLDRISRCTGAQIVPSVDHLSSPKLGHCDLFRVEKFWEEHGSAGQGGKKMLKTLMFFEGCPRPLGFTILLKGANGDELKKIKHVVQYGVFAAYHLALETSFLADEGASLPELPLKSPITVALPDKPSGINRSISAIPGFACNGSKFTSGGGVFNPNNVHDFSSKTSIPGKMEPELSPSHSGIISSITVESASSFSMEPFDSERLDMGVYGEAMLGPDPQNKTFLSDSSNSVASSDIVPGHFPSCYMREKNKVCFAESRITETFTDYVEVQGNSVFSDDYLKISERTHDDFKGSKRGCLSCFNDIQGEQQVESSEAGISYVDKDQFQERLVSKEEYSLSPSDHQSILVSLSSRCVWKGTVCERSHLFRIKYYGSFDKPLGRFLRDHLFDQSYRCPSCEMPSEAHIHCYTHQQGSLTISVRKLPEFHLPGERDGKIWMWHRCLRCPRTNGFPPATRRIVMSDAAWGLSFGKFLELSFSNHAAASRVASCGHSLHRDCLRFYGLGKMVACFRYASINVHSVCLPPHKLDFNYENQGWIQKEANEVTERKDQLFSEVVDSLQRVADKRLYIESLNGNVEVPEFSHYMHELEEMQQKEKEEFEVSLDKALKKEMLKGKSVIDILEVNKLKRQLVLQAYLWDQRLIYAAGSENAPHEFLSSFLLRDRAILSPAEKLVDFSVASKTPSGYTSPSTAYSDSRVDETIRDITNIDSHIDEEYDQPNNSNLSQPRMDTEVDILEDKLNKSTLCTSASEGAQLDPFVSSLTGRRALSDGQFPILANFSDTFDAKWTGENGPLITDLSLIDSSASVDTAGQLLVLVDAQEKGVIDVIQTLPAVPFSKLKNSLEEYSSWITVPFLSFYHFFNKKLCTAPRFEALSEYVPLYLSLFRDLERGSGSRLLLPVGENETVIPVYDDEPTSIISYALISSDYHIQMSDDRERARDVIDSSFQSSLNDPVSLQLSHSVEEISAETFKSFSSTEESLLSLSGSRSSLDPLLFSKTMHARVSFGDEGPTGKVRYTVTCYYAKRFDALRRTCCPSELDYIRSLSRCKKWGAQGGKSNVFFAKSLDDRFIIKQVTKTEIESFIKFAPEYFKYLSDSIATGSPTCLAKILGIYQVTSKQLKGGKEMKMDVLVMENLLYGRNLTRLYDLKGSSRSRYNPDSSGNNKVLLDQNLIEAMPTSPIFVGNKAKRLLERAVWNDTSFLASIDVMDYSLLVGVDESKHQLVLGIIDFMRQYTWDKHLETWVKASGILGGPKNVSPTVISPKQYKKRFRKAMSAYFLVVPDQWSPPSIVPSKLQPDLDEGNMKSTSTSSIP
ncbi:1-phosphatidylinositol-3-phosphate 5-kinase FAB1B [Apostasia shenzhenica]|uniref:1-phosphatidylinositol-3-phosphate 5-kinase n=1 Tax=Apostasia shenzhenica TaxID=1088818 RepID=A0A2I0B896_9ASPA|nr:1-phosphatidylinositol-3-phosphate 5-kinase FAB1B [Apostasia shenzhenica]